MFVIFMEYPSKTVHMCIERKLERKEGRKTKKKREREEVAYGSSYGRDLACRSLITYQTGEHWVGKSWLDLDVQAARE